MECIGMYNTHLPVKKRNMYVSRSKNMLLKLKMLLVIEVVMLV